ncbi:ephrin [Arctopsyche grandis]|uniref:ephrin n=1 Tax=Arctopsyche grandis TaxID=121162 RepID=UPI00406D74FA
MAMAMQVSSRSKSAAAAAPLLLVLGFCFDLAAANGKIFYINWNTTNSIFRIDNTDHVFDLNKGNPQFDYDQVNIVCPMYPPDKNDDNAEKYIIYNVSKEEYDTCRITNPNPRVIAICDKPHKLLFFTITFRPFSPQPGGLEFFPGRDYYFISTSTKDDLHRRIGGWCSTHNMKLVFRVCCQQEPPPTPAPPPPAPPPTAPRTTSTSTTPKSFLKKTPKPEKSLNDVLKSEELSFSGSRRPSLLPLVLPILIVVLYSLSR